ncbi:DNA recombination protein RmuC [Mariprofundus ferrinatatus]|uniref:DNA recombination protein RmuC n=1 Tax=Mariprofundus ferrinatatus TaxID=1921087 RepID=A0A2K8L7B4_9PROT|nr:DNA recombination protein RmuC [Mariprofundus ferrinatatus]ATX81751.1 DNA recombination protein RmuC [Mariprofundus ferrinatatus]
MDVAQLTQPAAIIMMALAAVLLIIWLVTFRNQSEKIETLDSENRELKAAFHELEVELTERKIEVATLSERIEQVSRKLTDCQGQLAEREHEVSQSNNDKLKHLSLISELETTLDKERQGAQEKLALLEDAKQKLAGEFKLLANEIFEEKGKSFSEQNRASLDEVLKPMREQLGDFRKRVDEVHLNDSKDRAGLREHLSQLEKLNRQMSEDALSLTHALKGDSKAQGNWGEMILERILETSGLRKDHEYLREDSTDIGGGKRLRPDVIVRMPGDKHIIIDSKVSLTDYERAVAATEGDARKKFIKAHANSLRNHVRGLADKHYAHLPGVNSPDYVLMFMPIEAAYMMAIEEDQGIFETAFEKGVAVVTPSTLYATLKLIEQLWRYERQSDDVLKLIDRAGKLHDKMASFVESFEEIGVRLGQAQKAYDISLNRISTGPGNVISQIDVLGKLAGKTKKELPHHLVESAALSDDSDGVREAD